MVFLPNANNVGWNAVPCNGPLHNYQTLVANVSQEERSNFYMNRRNSNVDVTTIYPWRRDIVATSSWADSYKDLCTSPNGVAVQGVTQLGVKLYRAPNTGVPPLNNLKCADCLGQGKNCGNCQGVY